MIGAYLLRMSIVISVIAIGASAVYAQLLSAFMSSPIINGGIIGVLGVGVLLCFSQVISLGREWRWMETIKEKLRSRPQDSETDFAAFSRNISSQTQPVLLAPLANMMLERTKISGDIRLSPASMHHLLDSVMLRLEENGDLLRYFVGLLVFLGLLGTFWGLMQTLDSIGLVIRNFSLNNSDIVASIENIRSGLSAPISGMSTAFSSSLFGLGGSLILGLLSLFSNQARNRFHNELEEWFSSFTRLGSVAGTDGGDQPLYVQSLLEHTADALDKLGWNLQQSQTQQKRTLEQLESLNTHISKLVETSDQSKFTRQIIQSSTKLETSLQQDRQEMMQQLRDELRLLGRVFAGQNKPGDSQQD